MPQLSKGDTFSDGQQVTGVRLNGLVDGATLLVGAITDQPNITANTLEATDSTIVNDAGTLKEATIGDILNSNLPITTSAISGVSGSDIAVTPASGQKVDVAGPFEADSINSTGALTVGGNATITGNLAVTGNVTGNINASGNFTNSGTVNLTGAFQVNGQVGYVLTDIVDEVIPHYGAINAGVTNSLHTTASFTKPAGEIWIMEISLRYYGAAGYVYEFAGRYGSQTPQTGSYLFYERRHDGQGGGAVENELYTCRWILTAAETLTAETIKIDTNAGSGSGLQLGMQTGLAGSVCSGPVYSSRFRIYKYKTA
jgi:hypothetical protein